jgi:exodeoxyribonuclease-1
MTQDSFLFYDLETFGQDPRRTRIAQFAAVRTDADLNVIDEHSFYVRPADDLLPSPIATLITGITPQHAHAVGVSEAEAFARINELMSVPRTCTLGYNTLRFDDEFVRHGLFRNFFDPYEREWRGGNSRWDLLDMLRLMHALRPQGIVWPQREDGGGTSFKLEHLADANGVRVGDAHEALSDVHATIAMAALFKQAQPKLWDYALKLRDKRHVTSMLDIAGLRPLLHVSMRYPSSRLCAAPVLPITLHPSIRTRIIALDLEQDISPLLELEPEAIAARVFTSRSALPEGIERIGLKEIHSNKCPALVRWDHLRAADFERLAIDEQAIAARIEQLRPHAAAVAEKVRRVYAGKTALPPSDADGSIYDGFLAEGDRAQLAGVRACPPQALGEFDMRLRDERLRALLPRYQARNYPDSLDADARTSWNAYRQQRLANDSCQSEYSFDSYRTEIAQLRQAHASDAGKLSLLDALDTWGDALEASL